MPTHHYIAFYRWLRDGFGADAVVHLGKHGTLEWTPGKGVGLSRSCIPEVCLPDMPHFYPFIINNPGEGTQAKRRSHAVIIDHLVPAMTTADSYGDITRCEQLMDEYARAQGMDPQKLPMLRQQIWEVVQKARLNEDLNVHEIPDDFDDFILHIDGYICELKDAQIRDGLHTLGEAPESEMLIGLLLALTRLNNGDIPGLRQAIGDALGIDYAAMMRDRSAAVNSDSLPTALVSANGSEPIRSAGDVVERLEAIAHGLYQRLYDTDFDSSDVERIATDMLVDTGDVPRVLRYVCDSIYPALTQTTDEIDALLRGFDGRFISPGPAGAPTRGMAGVLPTGRNFYSMDPRSIPSETSWQIGKELADSLVERYLTDEGEYPESVGISVWGTSAMRTHGDDISQILALIGVRPTWQEESRRVSGLEVIPLEELGRPRIDVTVRISGFFRDAFQNLIVMMDDAFHKVANLDEPAERNFVMKHYAAEVAEKRAGGKHGRSGVRIAVSHFRQQARKLRRGHTASHRRRELAIRRGPGECLYRVGFLRLRQAAARRERGAGVPPPLRRDRCRNQEPGQPRARHLRLGRLHAVPRRHDCDGARPRRRQPAPVLRRLVRPVAAADARPQGRGSSRVPLTRGQSQVDGLDEAAWLQGRIRACGDRRLHLRLRRHRADNR